MSIFQMAVQSGDTIILSLPCFPPQDFEVGSAFRLEGETWKCTHISEFEMTAVKTDSATST